MSTVELYTYADAMDALTEFGRAYGAGSADQTRRLAVTQAYRRFVRDFPWRYLRARGRIKLEAYQTTGTLEYDHTGGTYERQLTLTGATWPSDAENWAVRFDELICDIDQRKSDTVVTLDAVTCPTGDVAAGETYTCFKWRYPLPSDFISMGKPMEESDWLLGTETSYDMMMRLHRYEFETGGDVYYYCIAPAQDLYGSMALYTHGVVSAAQTYDYVYRRRPRQLKYDGKATNDSAGTIAVTAGAATVTGTSTAFASDVAGSIIRIGTDGTNVPTAWTGMYPYAEQRSILSRTSALALTLDGNIVTTRSGVKYQISDPIDIDVNAYDAFLDCCRAEYAKLTRMKTWDIQACETAYQQSLASAKNTDSPSTRRRFVGGRRSVHRRVADQGTVTIEEL